MINDTETIEEETTLGSNAPEHMVKSTTTHVRPQAQGDPPQEVYEKKKTIFRASQIIWYIAGLAEVLLVFRLALKVVGANPYVGFTNFIYGVTAVLIVPFQGIVGVTQVGNSVIEWSTIIAGMVYLCIAWGIVYLLDIVYPITPHDVAVR
jgi:hypothetical protein